MSPIGNPHSPIGNWQSPIANSPATSVDADNPWPGLAPFTEDQSAFFHGREEEIRALARLMERKALTVLFGQSGLGKSSLLQAGVFPRLRAAHFCPVYIRLDHSEGAASPVEQVKTMVLANAARAGAWTKPGAAKPGETLWEFFHHRDDRLVANAVAEPEPTGKTPAPPSNPMGKMPMPLSKRPSNPMGKMPMPLSEPTGRMPVPREGRTIIPVLVFDQFEELFTLGAARSTSSGSETARSTSAGSGTGAQRDRAVAFMSELAELVENRPSESLVERLEQSADEMEAFDFSRTDYRVCISLREDFLPHLEGLKTIMPALMENRMRLTRMTGRQALEAVLKPGGALVNEAVARTIVEFVSGARGGSVERLAELDVEPPLLSVICHELNERRRALGQPQISADLVSGNRREILTDFYERSVGDLPEPMRRFVEDKLLTKSGFRDNLALETALEEPGVTRPLIDTLVSRRLLRIEDRIGTQRVELTHDVLADVIRASRDQRQQRLAVEQAREREHRAHRRLWLARSVAITAVGLLAGVTWIAWRAVRAEREQQQLRAEAETLRGREAVLRQQAQVQELAARRKAYASDLNLTQQALASNNLGKARDLLYRQRPVPGQEDLRGWEWRYLWQLCQSDAQSIIAEQRSRISSLTVSSDAQWLAAAAVEKGELSLFNLQTREEVRVPAGDGYVCVAFSPREPLLAIASVINSGTASVTYRVLLWSLADRHVVQELPLEGFCARLAFAEDGARLVTAGAGSIVIWQVADGKKVADFRADYSGGIHGPFAATRDLKTGAHISRTKVREVRVVDLVTGAEKWSATAAEEHVNALAFSPDGKTLATAGGFRESSIQLWDVDSGKEIGRLEGHRTFVQSLVFRPDGKTLASASGDQTIRLWDLESRQLLKTLRGHTLEVWALALFPDGRTLASGSKDGAVFLWDTSTSRARRAVTALPKPIQAWRFAPDSNSVITIDAEGRVERWHGGAFEAKTELAFTRECKAAIFARDGSVVALRCADGRIEIWDWERQAKLREWPAAADLAEPLGFLARGNRVLLARGQGAGEFWSAVEEWDVADGHKTREWLIPVVRGLVKAALSADERRLLVTGWSGGHVALDISTGKILESGELSTRGAAISADGRFFAVPNNRGVTKLWDLEAAREISMLRGFLQGAHSAAFSADARRLVIGSGGVEALKIWDVASLEDLLTLEADGTITSNLVTAFSPNGDVLGSAFGQNRLHLWRAPSWEEIAAAERAAGAKTTQTGAPPAVVTSAVGRKLK